MRHFVAKVEAKFGKKENGRPDVLLILDGCKVHKDHPTLEFLKERGVQVIILSPNLTHVVQINDHSRMNGKLQEKVRTNKARLFSENGHVEVSFELRLKEIEKVIISSMSLDNVVEAARDIGYTFTEGFEHVGLNDASISTMLVKKEALKVVAKSSIREETKGLRDGRFLLARSMVAEGALPRGTASIISQEVIQATHRAMQLIRVVHANKRTKHETKLVRRKSAKQVYDQAREGTYVATGANRART